VNAGWTNHQGHPSNFARLREERKARSEETAKFSEMEPAGQNRPRAG
jgi:hypothetical protein